jgi:hypothetical protein
LPCSNAVDGAGGGESVFKMERGTSKKVHDTYKNIVRKTTIIGEVQKSHDMLRNHELLNWIICYCIGNVRDLACSSRLPINSGRN